MASGTAFVFDPTKTATSGAQGPPLSGGGLIAGAGTYYSVATSMENATLLADVISIASADFVGTLTLDCANSAPETDITIAFQAWQPYTLLNAGGFVNGVATLAAGAIVGGSNPGGYDFQRPTAFRRFRLRFVVASGSGSIRVTRSVKGGW